MPSTRVVMIASSICLAIAGVACLFVPSEILSLLGIPGGGDVIVQVLGALYIGLAAANWTARGSMIGGIYARPLSLANFFHFGVGAVVLAKGMPTGFINVSYIAVALIYLVFAVLFILVLYGRLERNRNLD